MKRRLISLPFFLLRTTTAGAAFVTGLLQTYVFAHILSPERFSVFILVAAIGYSLWLIDFGIVKILFVRLRAHFLASDSSDNAPATPPQSSCSISCLVACRRPAVFPFHGGGQAASVHATEFGLFFLFVALNLVWFALRNISIAVDEYVLFEALETVRRGGYFLGLGAVFFGLPLLVMLVALNLLWAVVLTVCARRMIARGALLPRIRGLVANLLFFFRANRAQLMRSGVYAASEIYIYNYPYLIVPMLFGLGAPPIILDTTFKVFRGGATIFGAVCEFWCRGKRARSPSATGRPWCARRLLRRRCAHPGRRRLRHSFIRRRPAVCLPARQRRHHAAGCDADLDRAADRKPHANGDPQRAGA